MVHLAPRCNASNDPASKAARRSASVQRSTGGLRRATARGPRGISHPKAAAAALAVWRLAPRKADGEIGGGGTAAPVSLAPGSSYSSAWSSSRSWIMQRQAVMAAARAAPGCVASYTQMSSIPSAVKRATSPPDWCAMSSSRRAAEESMPRACSRTCRAMRVEIKYSVEGGVGVRGG
eukprot:scaffold555_cov109-Isochrysis_galbana.AAC.7